MKKSIVSHLATFILGFIVASSVIGTLAYSYVASDISYTTNKNSSVQNVEQAINDLYSRIPTIKLTLGETYQMGGFDWTATETITGGYVLQSQGMTAGSWPGYLLTSNYDGTVSYGSADSYYRSDISFHNIANYDSVTSNWYSNWQDVELSTQNHGSGLYLIPYSYCNVTQSGVVGSGYYHSALTIAANKAKTIPATSGYSSGSRPYSSYSLAWLGNTVNFTSRSTAWCVGIDGTVYNGYYGDGNYVQNTTRIIAPAFNLDATMVYLDGTEIKKVVH